MKLVTLVTNLVFLCGLLATTLAAEAGKAPFSAPPPPPPLLIKDRSYAIRAEMMVKFPQTSSKFSIQETYSHWQARSVVRYRYVGGSMPRQAEAKMPQEATFYASGQRVLLVDRTMKNCTVTTFKLADDFFNLGVLNEMLQSAIIGPSKFLHFITTKLDQFTTRAPVVLKDRAQTKLVRYDYELDAATYFSLYYQEDANRNLPNGIPLEAVIKTGAGRKYIISYAFKRIEMLPQVPVFGSNDGITRQYHMETDPVEFESLIIEPNLGCGRREISAADKTAASEKKLMDTEFRFSFKAPTVMAHTSEPVDMLVGYEPSIGSLRVDRVFPTKLTETLVSYKTNLSFHTIKRLSAQDMVLDGILSVGRTSTAPLDSSCVVSETARSASGRELTRGELLLGTNEATYLGLARVRGIEARVYEAYNSSWPVWYQQPISYYCELKEDRVERRDESCSRANTDQKEHFILNTVFYISSTASSLDEGLSDGRLLRIEISRLSRLSSMELERTIIPIYEFSTQLPKEAPNGQSWVQFHSLADSCGAPASGDNHYGQVDLLLQRNGAPEPDTDAGWLREPARRNLALLRVVQERCKLPASMIQDLDSRLKLTPAGPRQTMSLLATLRVIEHTRSLARLVRVGRGDLRRQLPRGIKSFPAGFFQSCFAIAAHMKEDTVIVYSLLTTSCTIYRNGQLDMSRASVDTMFNLKTSPAAVEIYRVEHTVRPHPKNEGDQLTELARSQKRFSKLNSLTMADPKWASSELKLELKSVEVRELERKSPVLADQTELDDTNKFIGFELVAGTDELNRRIEPDRMSARENGQGGPTNGLAQLVSQMTFGWCQAECLADFECRSYSVCVRDSQLDCVVSRVNFGAPNMVAQLAQLKWNKQIRLGQIVPLQLEPSETATNATVQIRKRPSCELHNKFHLDFFHESGLEPVNILRRRLHPVLDREQCAKLCLTVTVETLRAELRAAHKVSLDLLSSNSESRPEDVRRAYRNLIYTNTNICASFFYLDRADFLGLDAKLRDSLTRITGASDSDSVTNGYCIVGDVLSNKEYEELKKSDAFDANSGAPARLDMRVEEFGFDFSLMFERHQGLSLATSEMSSSLKRAYRKVKVPTSFETTLMGRESYELIRAFLAQGENIAESMVGEPNDCARVCFMQLSNLWPACKSFDVFEMNFEHGKETHCFFNTRSLREILLDGRMDLVRTTIAEQTRMAPNFTASVAHYEPKPGFVSQSLALESRLELAEDYLWSLTINYKFRVNYLVLVGSLLVALTAGLACSLALGARLLRAIGVRQNDKENLIDQTALDVGD